MFSRHLLAGAMLACSTFAAAAETKLPFSLDWRFEGPAAPYVLAVEKGYFAGKGLDVEISAGKGSLDAIPKVATGAFPVGLADLEALIKFLDANPGAPVTAAMVIYNKPATAMVGRKSLGVEKIADIQGKVLGAPPPDGAWAQFPLFAKLNGLDMDTITVEPVGFPTREPMLAEGNVQAVTGFSFSVFLSLARLGVPEDDISVFLFADNGIDYYGSTVIVNTDYAAEHPEEITAFLTGIAEGWQSAIADPAAAVEAMKPYAPAMDPALETRRLQLAIDGNVLTDEVKENGFGGMLPERFAHALEQMQTAYEFKNAPTPELYFTDAYLPAPELRKLP
ncbi:ABC transporter substrate-binding protein [Thalassovita mangrovi]|uniref:Thiamine pyrimidine synthase n=1 Tax=Thalassovita mangrovi TaxID=2692236 RepID=A0A6L8LM06_9RHOB|nr:ABC transporter substrate-binding protein [Thalassovita mangrovi]MYM57067.1 ABC transporter substrate-binding protein [Thalassovita mangrovi]